MQLEQFTAHWQPLIREALQHQLQRVGVPQLQAAMAHLLGRGKLFRPLLALITYDALHGGEPEAVLRLVTPLELIHTFTLIHDDLPCMDDAELRRGVPAVHRQFGEANAVLAGDALANLALHLIASETAPVTAEVRLLLVRSATRATAAVVEGQMLDLLGERRRLSADELERMERLKTGALIGACCETGALLAGGSADLVTSLLAIGERIGLAFQVRDDLLSIEATEEQAGKTLSTDLKKEKSTYVRALGLEGARHYLERLIAVAADEIHTLNLPKPELLLAITHQAAERDR